MSLTTSTQDDVMLLMKDLRDQGAKLFLDADTVRVRAPKSGIDESLKERLRMHKKDVIAVLRSAGNGDIAAIRIPPRTPGAPVVLSFLQRKLWLIDQIMGGSIHYNMSMSMRVEGELDIENLRRTFETIVERHESLRTTFRVDAHGVPHQVVAERFRFELPVTDLSALPSAERDARADALRREEENGVFDLAADLMLRARLVRLAPGSCLLLATKHHIASDGWSMDVFMDELCRIYAAYGSGRPHGLEPLPIQYGDYAAWMHDWLRGPVLERQVDYWTRQLAGLPVLHRLPLDRPRPQAQTMHGARLARRYPKRHTERLEALAREHEVTLFMLLESIFAMFLSKWSGEEDIVIGTPISNRFKPELNRLIGFFTNTLVLRSRCDGDTSFADFLRASKTMLLDAHEHQHMPFETLIDILNPPRDLAYNPLVQIVFALQNNEAATVERIRLPGIEIAELPPNGNVNVKFDLDLSILESPDGLLAKWTYNTDLFDEATIERMAGYFEFLIECVLDDPSVLPRALPLPQADAALIAAWNRTETPFPADSTICGMFEAQARLAPSALAVLDESSALSYAELNSRADSLARRLVGRYGIGAGDLVGISVQRGTQMMVGLLAIMKAGGAYVPFDPVQPRERLAHMVKDSGVALVLTQPGTDTVLADLAVPLLDIHDPAAFGEKDDIDLRGRCRADSLAYVIYTSGSTGKPKGTLNLHRGVCNRLHAMQRQFDLTPADRVLQKTPLTFDVSVWEMFWPLACGAALVLARPDGHKDPDYLADAARRHGITVLHFVPSMLEAFLDGPSVSLPALRYLMTSGEALDATLQARCIAAFPGVGLHNHYGPTETAIEVSWWPFDVQRADRKVPIGRPIANTQLHILDRYGRPVPVGVVGELHIGGVQVGEGYLNLPELTAEKFVMRELFGAPQRLYRTGDLARWLEDGNIEYIGRIDFQIKLRGMRMELGEVEAALRQLPYVRNTVVVVRGSGADATLVAYVVPQGEDAPSDAGEFAARAGAALRQHLPAYMLPAMFVLLESLPLSANGKVDRARLPEPARRTSAAAVALEGETESRLGRIWREVLDVELVGATDSFFELGGHSLQAMRMVSAIGAEFGVTLPVVSVFARPRLRGLAEQVDRLRVKEHNASALAALNATHVMEW